MTREEIEKNRQYQLTGAAIDYCRKEHPHYDGETLGEITDAFETGAEWEHKRLIDKACEWLSKNKDNYIIDIEGETIVSEEIINDFKQAMKE